MFEKYSIGSVVNISGIILSETEISLLSRGLNFCPTPGEPDFSEVKQDLDKFHTSLRRMAFFSSLPPGEDQPDPDTDLIDLWLGPDDPPFDDQKFKLQSYFSPIGPKCLETFIEANERDLSKVPIRAPRKRNMAREEYQCADKLAFDKRIIIKPADKGSAVVIMNHNDYIQEAHRQLSDPNFYKETKEDLTSRHRDLVVKEIYKLFDNFQIGKKCKAYLLKGGNRTALFYLLPKIHKNVLPPPGRPILSANDCPTEKISALVNHFFKATGPRHSFLREGYYTFP